MQPKVSHANILSIDTSEAEKMPGVPRCSRTRTSPGTNRIFGSVTYPWNKGDGYDRPILCDTKIFQYGDVVAMVLADTKKQAEAAAKKVKVGAGEAAGLHELPRRRGRTTPSRSIPARPTCSSRWTSRRATTRRSTSSSRTPRYVVEDDYYTQRQPHLHHRAGRRLRLHRRRRRGDDPLQEHRPLHGPLQICEGLGLEAEKLRLIQNPQGGNFGYKIGPTLEALCAVATMATGRPLLPASTTTHQHMIYTGKRAPCFSTVKMAADDEDGKLVAMDFDLIMDHGAYSEFADELLTKGLPLHRRRLLHARPPRATGAPPSPTTPWSRPSAPTADRRARSPPT